jgi:hypothetical protein
MCVIVAMEKKKSSIEKLNASKKAIKFSPSPLALSLIFVMDVTP